MEKLRSELRGLALFVQLILKSCIDLIITKSNVLFRMFLFLEEKRKEKQKLRVEKMATRPNRKYQTTREQIALLEEFYRELDEEDQLFLGNRFVGEENDTDTDYESDNNEADIAAEDLEEEPTIDSNVEDLEVEPVEAVTEQGNDELPTKQKFKNLTEVLNEANYSDVPA